MKTRAVLDLELGQPISVQDVDLEDPGPDEVVVRVFASGVCHSQLHQMHDPDAERPQGLGHEATGVVEYAGPEVTHVRPGDHVMVSWIPRDLPDPYTVVRRVSTWAEHVVCSQQNVVLLDRDLPVDATAIIGCAVVTGVGAVIGSAKVQPGETVAVFGVGGVGINVIAGAKIADAGRVIAVDLSEDKLEFARRFGATDTVNAAQTDPVQAIRDLTGRGPDDPVAGVDYAFDAIGLEAVINQCLAAVRPGVLGYSRGGAAVVVGIPAGPVTLDPLVFPRQERRLIGSHGGSATPEHDFKAYLRWYREGLLPLDEMITRRYQGLEGAIDATHALARGEVTGRALLEFSTP